MKSSAERHEGYNPFFALPGIPINKEKMMTPKFRAWHIKRKEMYPVEGLLYLSKDPRAIIFRDGLYRNPLPFGGENPRLILMQFSDQKDKDGDRVAAGDIVDFEYGIGIVFQDEKTSSFKIEFDTDVDNLWLYCPDVDNCLKIIGNIYGNRDLIPTWYR